MHLTIIFVKAFHSSNMAKVTYITMYNGAYSIVHLLCQTTVVAIDLAGTMVTTCDDGVVVFTNM